MKKTILSVASLSLSLLTANVNDFEFYDHHNLEKEIQKQEESVEKSKEEVLHPVNWDYNSNLDCIPGNFEKDSYKHGEGCSCNVSQKCHNEMRQDEELTSLDHLESALIIMHMNLEDALSEQLFYDNEIYQYFYKLGQQKMIEEILKIIKHEKALQQ